MMNNATYATFGYPNTYVFHIEFHLTLLIFSVCVCVCHVSPRYKGLELVSPLNSSKKQLFPGYQKKIAITTNYSVTFFINVSLKKVCGVRITNQV